MGNHLIVYSLQHKPQIYCTGSYGQTQMNKSCHNNEHVGKSVELVSRNCKQNFICADFQVCFWTDCSYVVALSIIPYRNTQLLMKASTVCPAANNFPFVSFLLCPLSSLQLVAVLVNYIWCPWVWFTNGSSPRAPVSPLVILKWTNYVNKNVSVLSWTSWKNSSKPACEHCEMLYNITHRGSDA